MARKPQNSSSSWRKLQQGNRRTKTTKAARQRSLMLFFRTAMIVLLVLAAAAGILAIYLLSGFGRGSSEPVGTQTADVTFESNGVLTENWFRRSYAESLHPDVRQIDVHSLKERLESHGQVEAASVGLSLPSTLQVSIEEREPILRMRIRNSDGSSTILLIARDGMIYEGALYPRETLRILPGVSGLRVKRTEEGFQPLGGLEAVAYLLDIAKEEIPAVYRHWQVVDLSDWNPEVDYRPSLVRVKSSHIEEIIFSTYGIEEQINRLSGILQHIERYQLGQPKLIDLSFGEEAVIRYK